MANHTGRSTLAQVADAAGVSLPTASKVLNGRADVSDATRLRVEKAFRELDYLPYGKGRLAAGVRTVDLVVDSFVSYHAMQVLTGVVDAGAESGIDVIAARFPTDQDGPLRAEDSWAQRLLSGGREGLIVVTSELTTGQINGFARANIPLVVIDPINLPRTDVVSVGATNWSGGMAATSHLIELGHRRIAFAGGPEKSSPNLGRLHGYRAALQEAGITPDPDLIRHANRFHSAAGERVGTGLLTAANPPTAIFAASDSLAVGVLQAARKLGLRVPEDLSVVGFDDTDLATLATPLLTTVRQPLQEMGRVAMRTLLQLIAGDTLDFHHVELSTNLVVRNSTAPPGTRA